ncbi:MAG: glucuronyl esterase domain-containing protein [Inquilinaceae bacterium]
MSDGAVSLADVLTGPDGGPIRTVSDRAAAQAGWRAAFARHLYGPVPEPPVGMVVGRQPLFDLAAERLTIALNLPDGSFTVDAALWLPRRPTGPVPLIAGLGFLGPIGVLDGRDFPLDPRAIIGGDPQPWLPGGRMSDAARGRHRDRWPLQAVLARGFGLLLSCYGSWAPDHPRAWRRAGVAPFLDEVRCGALSLWAWAFQRLVDVALTLPEVAPDRVAVIGHSRLAKAALWAGASDDRIAAVVANNAGCAGTAPSRRGAGETLRDLKAVFPHWAVLTDDTADDPRILPVDQHHLIACLAPRGVYVASASEDWWADPEGEYLSLRAAAPIWGIGGAAPDMPPIDRIWRPGEAWASGPIGWHLRDGRHDLTPWDWVRFLDFLETRL